MVVSENPLLKYCRCYCLGQRMQVLDPGHVQHNVTINALNGGKAPHGGGKSPHSSVLYPSTRSNSSMGSAIDGISSHPLHEEGMRPRSGSNRDTSVTAHATAAASSLYVMQREPAIAEHSESAFLGGATSATHLGSVGASLNRSSHPLLPSEHEAELRDSGAGAIMAMGGFGLMAGLADAEYNDDSDGYSATGDGREGYDDEEDGEVDVGMDADMSGDDEGDVEMAGRGSDRQEAGAAREAWSRERAGGPAPLYRALPAAALHRHSAATGATDSTKATQTATNVKYVAWGCMLLAILSGAAIGPAFKVMESFNVPPLLAASWRCQCMSFVLLPLAWLESYCKGAARQPVAWMSIPPPPERGSPHAGDGKAGKAQYRLVTYMLLAGAGWGINLLAWVSALKYTTTVRASIFTGLHPLFLVMYYACRGRAVSQMEWVGVLVACTGIACTIFDETPEQLLQSDSARQLEWFGLLLCICSAIAEVLILVCRGVVGTNVPTMLYTFCTTVEVAVISAVMCLATGQASDMGFGDTGLLGWLTAKWAAKMFLFGFVVGVICVAGFNFAMTHISALVFSACLLVDPAVTGLISYAIKLERWPGPYTAGGGVIVVAGVGCIMVGEHRRQLLEASAATHLEARRRSRIRRLEKGRNTAKLGRDL